MLTMYVLAVDLVEGAVVVDGKPVACDPGGIAIWGTGRMEPGVARRAAEFLRVMAGNLDKAADRSETEPLEAEREAG